MLTTDLKNWMFLKVDKELHLDDATDDPSSGGKAPEEKVEGRFWVAKQVLQSVLWIEMITPDFYTM